MDLPSEEHGMTERALRGRVWFVPSVDHAGEGREHGCERLCPPQNSGSTVMHLFPWPRGTLPQSRVPKTPHVTCHTTVLCAFQRHTGSSRCSPGGRLWRAQPDVW